MNLDTVPDICMYVIECKYVYLPFIRLYSENTYIHMSMSSLWMLLTMICLNFTLAASVLTDVMFSIKELAVQTEEKRPT